MKPSHDQHNDFFAHEAIPGLTLEHNDSVEVVGGEHKGALGSLVSIEELGDDPLLLVELGDGKDVLIRQSLLRLCAS